MHDEEIEHLNSMDDEITVYRGGAGTEPAETALSWTTNENTAVYYAKNRDGYVYKGVVNKSDILSIFFEENEVIARPHTVNIIERYLPE